MFLDAIDLLLTMSLAYVVIIAVILMARPLVAVIAGTNWAYRLWGVLLVPPLVALAPATIFAEINSWQYSIPDLSAADSIQALTLGLWLVGTAAAGVISVRQSSHVRRTILRSSNPVSGEEMAAIQNSCDRANVFPAPKAVLCSRRVSPAVMGGLTPTLVLPSDFFDKYSSSERNLILHHELVHLRRLDLVWNILFRGLRCLLWFVPVMKHCEKMFRADQERSCDHSVVCDEPGSGRAEYARALYKTVLPSTGHAGLAGFRNTRHELVLRTELLHVHQRTSAKSIAGSVALLVCILLAVSVSANANAVDRPAVPSSGWCSIYNSLGM